MTTADGASGTSTTADFYCHTRSMQRVGSLTWKVEGLADACMFRHEPKVWISPEFSIPGSERVFSIHMKTRTDTSPEEGYVGLFLHYVKGPEYCSVYFHFSFLTSSDSRSHTQTFHARFSISTGDIGHTKIITRKELLDQNSQLILNNEVTVLCVIDVLEEPQVSKLYSRPSCEENVHSNCSILSEEWKHFYEQKLNTDIVLKVGREQFMAHKAVLMCRSPVFRAMLSHDMREKISGEVVIQYIDSDTFQELLQYMYTNNFTRRNPNLVARLMVAADRYGMEHLKSRCSDYLCGYVKPDNVLQILKLTELYSSVEIDKACLSVVNQELFPGTCIINCMKKMKDLPQVLDLLKKRFVEVDRPAEQNKRHCPDSRGVPETAPALPSHI